MKLGNLVDGFTTTESEDCLTLNICVESKKAAWKKPVFVIFHHGDFSYGGSAAPLLSGYNFIKSYQPHHKRYKAQS